MTKRMDRGFTLVELLVVIAIIGMLIALLLPALQQTRQVARRASCANNLAQLGLALAQYESAFECLPAGTTNPSGPIRNRPPGEHVSWIVRMLPYIEQRNTYRALDLSQGVYAPANHVARGAALSTLICPSSSANMGGGGRLGVSDYAGCCHDLEQPIDTTNHGVMFLNSAVRLADIGDGASHTFFVGEKLPAVDGTGAFDLGWASGTRATLRNTGTRLNVDRAAFVGNLGQPDDWAKLEVRLARGESLQPTDSPDTIPIDPDSSDEEARAADAVIPDAQDRAASSPADDAAASQDVNAPEAPSSTEQETAQPAVTIDGQPPAMRGPLWVGGFASEHHGGAQFLFGDGAVRYINEMIDLQVYRQLGHRDDGQLLSDDAY